jgi:hypothetical protein
MDRTNKWIAALKKMVWPGFLSQIMVFGAWVSSGLSGGYSQAAALLQSSATRVADLSLNMQVYLMNLIRHGQGPIGGIGGIGGSGGPGSGGQVVYGPPNPFNPGYTPGTWPGGTGTLPGGAQPVYGAPINPGYIPPGSGQPIYGAPLGNPGTGIDGGQGTPINSVMIRLTDMINLQHITPEAVISLIAYALWILITFWALFGWAFWGLVLYIKKREAFKKRNE